MKVIKGAIKQMFSDKIVNYPDLIVHLHKLSRVKGNSVVEEEMRKIAYNCLIAVRDDPDHVKMSDLLVSIEQSLEFVSEDHIGELVGRIIADFQTFKSKGDKYKSMDILNSL